MTDYAWPSSLVPKFSTLSWADNTARYSAPYSGVVRTVSRPGGAWRLSMSFSGLTAAQGQTLEAFLDKLSGGAHTATVKDFAYKRQGTGGGTPVVEGASQTGLTLQTSGWNDSETVLKAGDRIQVGNEMMVVADDFTTDNNILAEDGTTLTDESDVALLTETITAGLSLTFPIRTSPANGASIETASPTARYVLADSAEVISAPGVFKNISVELIESLA